MRRSPTPTGDRCDESALLLPLASIWCIECPADSDLGCTRSPCPNVYQSALVMPSNFHHQIACDLDLGAAIINEPNSQTVRRRFEPSSIQPDYCDHLVRFALRLKIVDAAFLLIN